MKELLRWVSSKVGCYVHFPVFGITRLHPTITLDNALAEPGARFSPKECLSRNSNRTLNNPSLQFDPICSRILDQALRLFLLFGSFCIALRLENSCQCRQLEVAPFGEPPKEQLGEARCRILRVHRPPTSLVPRQSPERLLMGKVTWEVVQRRPADRDRISQSEMR